MSYADKVFKQMCRTILDEGDEVLARPIWEDTDEQAKVIKKFGIVNRYNLSEEFPAMTLRPIGFKNCVDEIFWIYQQKSNNVNDLNSRIWDEWATSDGKIGLGYGYQVANCFRAVQNETVNDNNYKYKCTTSETLFLDQIDYVIHELKNNPFSRRIIINLYNVGQTNMMNLDPCCYSCTFNVTVDKEDDSLVLNNILNQRSNDVLVANNWNVVQYAALQCMLAQICGMKVGELVHVIADAHIYDRHIPIINELIKRVPYEAPKLWINPDIDDFYDFTVDDIKLLDYTHHSQIKNIPVAI